MSPWLWALTGAGVILLLAGLGLLAWWLLRRAKGKAGAATAAAPPLGADLQDPLPESNWFWRRLLFLTAALAHAGAYAFILWKVGQLGSKVPGEAIAALVQLGLFVTILICVDRVLYTLAPSGEQLIKMMNVVSLLKGGVSLFSRAEARTAEGTATSTVSAGPAATSAAATQPASGARGRLSDPPDPNDPTNFGGPRE